MSFWGSCRGSMCVVLLGTWCVAQGLSSCRTKVIFTYNTIPPSNQKYLYPPYYYQWLIFHTWRNGLVALTLTNGKIKNQ